MKKTALITPKLAVLPSAWPYERSSVVNSKRRASVRLVCQPLIVTVWYGIEHPFAGVRGCRLTRIDRVETVNRQRHRDTNTERIAQLNRVLATFQRLDIPTALMRIPRLRRAADEDFDRGRWLADADRGVPRQASARPATMRQATRCFIDPPGL